MCSSLPPKLANPARGRKFETSGSFSVLQRVTERAELNGTHCNCTRQGTELRRVIVGCLIRLGGHDLVPARCFVYFVGVSGGCEARGRCTLHGVA